MQNTPIKQVTRWMHAFFFKLTRIMSGIFLIHATVNPCNYCIPATGRYKTWTWDSGLDYGLDYGLHYGLDFGLGWTENSVLDLLFNDDFECWIAQ